MRNKPCVAILILLKATGVAHAQEEPTKETVTLAVGEQTTISSKDVQAYKEGPAGVVSFSKTKDEFVIVAMKPGTSSLLLLYGDGRKVQYTIRVLPSSPQDSVVSEKENIRLDFYFVELSDNYTHQIGVGWPADIGGSGVFRANATVDLKLGQLVSATAVVANQPLPRLDILQATGWVRIGRHAVLVTVNGNEASFSSGGEVNLAVQGALTAEIRRIEFGSVIKVLPRYDKDSGRVELTISADVSDLTSDRGSGIPGRTVSKLETLVNLELGQGVMLAGLDAHTEASGKTGLPLLSQIPVLGWLFGSHGNREEHTQNVLFIVPTVVDVVAVGARARIDEAFRVYSDYDGDLDDVDLIGKPRGEAARRRSGR